MKRNIIILLYLLTSNFCYSQTKKITAPQVPCDGTADAVPGIYTNHMQSKYGINLKGNAAEKAGMMKTLIAIEKLEEASRKNFTLTGCAARVSFARWGNSYYNKNSFVRYGYQLGVYEYVCHVTEHVPKIVDEYRTVVRIDINPDLRGFVHAGGTGEFSISGPVRYEIPIEAKEGPDFERDMKNNPSKVSQYISEAAMLTNRSNNYKNNHADFLKVINGEGYVENWIRGDRYGKNEPGSYKWIDRRYLITRPGVPLLVAVSRKQYLEDMLEYLEIEKANFNYSSNKLMKDIVNEQADWAKKKRLVLEEDIRAYPVIYDAKKAKLKSLLANSRPEWLQKPAVVDNNNRTYDANKRLESLGKFYETEDEYTSALYVLNPTYFKSMNEPPTKPLFIEVQFRYELAKGNEFSERLFNNFLTNFDMEALRKMLD